MTNSTSILEHANVRIYLKIFLWLSALLFTLIFAEGIKCILVGMNPLGTEYLTFSSFTLVGTEEFSLSIFQTKDLLISILLFVGLLSYFLRYIIWTPWPLYFKAKPFVKNSNNNSLARREMIWSLIYLLVEFIIIYLIILTSSIPMLAFALLLCLPLVDTLIIMFRFIGTFSQSLFVFVITIIYVLVKITCHIPSELFDLLPRKETEESKEESSEKKQVLKSFLEKSSGKIRNLIKSLGQPLSQLWNFVKSFGIANLLDIGLPIVSFLIFLRVQGIELEGSNSINDIIYTMPKEIQNIFKVYFGSALVLSSTIVFILDGFFKSEYSKIKIIFLDIFDKNQKTQHT